jgi:hypothetical protein
MDVVKRLADEYNKISEVTSKAGMQQFLHDEGFEMAKVDGRLVYEVLLELLDPKLVEDAVPDVRDANDRRSRHVLREASGRFISMHLQGVDLNAPLPSRAAAATARRRRERQPRLAEDLRRREGGGLKNYFLEQNWDLTVQGVRI